MRKDKCCQSCGMPLTKDKNRGGAEKNNSKSTKYCSHCYLKGKFTSPDISVQEMQKKVYNKLKEYHFPSFLRYFL